MKKRQKIEKADKILVSACLMGENCKYNGGNNESEKLKKYIEITGCKVVQVCPEVMGGLPTPRVPSEIVDGVVKNKEGKSVDREFHLGARKALEIAKKEKAGCAILQSRSPSCGSKQIYDGSFTGKKIPGMGIFAEMLKENGFQVIDIEELEIPK